MKDQNNAPHAQEPTANKNLAICVPHSFAACLTTQRISSSTLACTSSEILSKLFLKQNWLHIKCVL